MEVGGENRSLNGPSMRRRLDLYPREEKNREFYAGESGLYKCRLGGATRRRKKRGPAHGKRKTLQATRLGKRGKICEGEGIGGGRAFPTESLGKNPPSSREKENLARLSVGKKGLTGT